MISTVFQYVWIILSILTTIHVLPYNVFYSEKSKMTFYFSPPSRSKRKVLGRKERGDSFGSRQSLVSPVKHSTSGGDLQTLTLGSTLRSSSRNDNFMALLQKKGSKSSRGGTRLSAMELLKSTNPLARRITEFSASSDGGGDTTTGNNGTRPPQDQWVPDRPSLSPTKEILTVTSPTPIAGWQSRGWIYNHLSTIDRPCKRTVDGRMNIQPDHSTTDGPIINRPRVGHDGHSCHQKSFVSKHGPSCYEGVSFAKVSTQSNLLWRVSFAALEEFWVNASTHQSCSRIYTLLCEWYCGSRLIVWILY